MEHEASSATVELAALALGTDAARIAKTLSFLNGERTLLVVAAGDARVDSAKFKKAFGIKTKARTSRAYAKEMTEQIKEAYGL